MENKTHLPDCPCIEYFGFWERIFGGLILNPQDQPKGGGQGIFQGLATWDLHE